MQDIAAHHRIDHARRENVDQQIAKTLWLCLHQLTDVSATGQNNSRAGLSKIHYAETDKQRGRRHNLKVQERLHAHASDFFQIATAGNANDQRRKD